MSSPEPTLPEAPASTLAWGAIADLLGLPPTPGRDLAHVQVFDGPGGLVCRLRPAPGEDAGGLRPGICLGLHVDDVPRNGIGALFSIQATLLASGAWFLGMDDSGSLELTALTPARSAEEVAAFFCEGHLTAWTTLSALMAPESDAPPPHDPSNANRPREGRP